MHQDIMSKIHFGHRPPEVIERKTMDIDELRLALTDASSGDLNQNTGRFLGWDAIATYMSAKMAGRFSPVIGVSGPQGSGKTTLALSLVEKLRASGYSAEAVSLDDFYLPLADRQALGQSIHPMLATRGVPGTHDVAWMGRVLHALTDQSPGCTVSLQLPVFDKGLDDRVDLRTVEAEILVIEGWCLGVTAQTDSALETPINRLERESDGTGLCRRWVNQQIVDHYLACWTHVGCWLQLRIPDFKLVARWRGQQEQSLPAERRMTEVQLANFINHYERLTRWQAQCPPLLPGLSVALDEAHQVHQVDEHF